jgi:hypothetical protein
MPDRAALLELVNAAPRERPDRTGPEGTLVGTDTRVAAPEPKPEPSVALPPAPSGSEMAAGPLEFLPMLSTPAIERAAREQIYWTLSKKCLGPDGKPPPPDTITITFTIQPDGGVDPASVAAKASSPRYEATAECVLREFSALPFRGPTATFLTTARIMFTWPSVD